MHLEAEPNYVYPLADVIMKFEMPGSGMPDYLERSEVIAEDVNYGPEQYYTQVLNTLWNFWGITELAPTLAEAREAQQRVVRYHMKLGRIAARLTARREKKQADHENGNGSGITQLSAR